MRLLIVIILFAFLIPVNAKSAHKTRKEEKKHVAKISVVSTQASGADSVNIREMVRQQIEEARKKSQAAGNQPVLHLDVVKKAEPVKTGTGFWEGLIKHVPLSGDALVKILIISAFSFFVFGIIIIRRLFSKKISSGNGKKVKELKKNISLIREERPLKLKEKNKLRSVRSKLIKNYSGRNLTNENMSKTARELNIAEGELMLAERIKMHGMAGSYSGKK